MPSSIEASIAQLIDQLEDVHLVGAGYSARCPSHEDRSPSLSINPGNKGWLVYCHAGCHIGDILDHVGLRVADLFYDSTGGQTDTASSGLRSLIRRTTPVDLWQLERFDDVAWATWPHKFEDFVLACVQYHDVVSLPFPEAGRYWTIIRDGFLWTWLGADTWPTARNTIGSKLWATYNDQPVTT